MNIACTIYQELIHMWFGNLVTMDWWNYLWLNEEFARWVASISIKNISTRYYTGDTWTLFILDDLDSRLKRDSSKSIHKISIDL